MAPTWVKFHVPIKVFLAVQLSLAIGFSLKQLLNSQLPILREIVLQDGRSSNSAADVTVYPTFSTMDLYNNGTTTSRPLTENNITSRQELHTIHIKNLSRQTIHTNKPSLPNSNFSCDVVDGNLTWNGPVFPHLIIVGAAKAGTTAINHFLSQVPNFLSTMRPEPHFWDFKVKERKVDKLTPADRCKLIHQYRDYWDTASIGPNTFLYEKTPSLLAIAKSANAIRKILNPHVPKILIILRDPIDRFYSHYKMSFQRKELNNSSVEDVVIKEIEKLKRMSLISAQVPNFSRDEPQQEWNQSDFEVMPESADKNLRSSMLARGMYAPFVEDYLKSFPLGTSLKVIQYENFTKNKRNTLMELLEWLGAPTHNWTDEDLEDDHGPVQVSVPIPVMSDGMTNYLKHLYRPFNDKLADLLGENWRGIWDVEQGTVKES